LLLNTLGFGMETALQGLGLSCGGVATGGT